MNELLFTLADLKLFQPVENIGDILFQAALGFLFVFAGITVLILIFTLLGKVMGTANKKKKTPQKEPKAEETTLPQAVEEGISPETVAVITAAIAAYLGEGQKCDFVVRRIKRL